MRLEKFEHGLEINALAEKGETKKVVIEELLFDLKAACEAYEVERAFLSRTMDKGLLLHLWISDTDPDGAVESWYFPSEDDLARYLWDAQPDRLLLELLRELNRLTLITS